MDPNNDYYNQWLAGQQSGNPRFLPVTATFADGQPNLAKPQPLDSRQQYPVQFQHDAQFVQPQQIFQEPQPQPQNQILSIPLIPPRAVEELRPPNALLTEGFQDPFNRAYAIDGPAVFEGFIPAPGHEEEEDYLDQGGFDASSRDQDFGSSDEEDEARRIRAEEEEEEEEELRQIEERDDSEVDADYSSEDAQHDEGDPDEMELLEDFEDTEERVRYKKSRSTSRVQTGIKGTSNNRGGLTTRGSRGGRRGRPSGQGRGASRGSLSTRGKRGAKRGRPSGPRGPRRVADPGNEFKELQRQANERFIAKDYEAALGYAQKAIQMNPEIFDAYNIASEIYAAMGEEESSIAALIAGAPTKRDTGLWQFIIERINKLDPEKYPDYSETAKTAAVLACLNQIILLNDNYEARSHKLEIEARLGHASKCMVLGIKMLKTRKEQGEDPDVEVLKIMAMMGTSSSRQTRMHLDKLLASFDEAIEVYTDASKDPSDNDFDWEMINIYLDLLDKKGDYSKGITQLRRLSRWKQGRVDEIFWDQEMDDREFDIEDEPRRVAVSRFQRRSQDAKYGQTLPLEIRVKLGLFRLRLGVDNFLEAMVSQKNRPFCRSILTDAGPLGNAPAR